MNSLSPCQASMLAFSLTLEEADLQEQDIYSLEKLKDIQIKRFNCNLDFYVALVKEGTKKYVFEGSRFTEDFIKKCQQKKEMSNPLTRKTIHSFEVFRYNKGLGDANQKPERIQEINKESIPAQVSLMPILWSDHTRTDEERGRFYFLMGNCYYTGNNCALDMKLAITHYRKGAVLGDRKAQFHLSRLLAKHRQFPESLYWTLKYWQSEPSVSIDGWLQISFAFEDCDLLDKAFLSYRQAAYQGNAYAIGKIIYYYEQGFGVAKDLDQAALWRQALPDAWRDQEIVAYMQYVSNPDYSAALKNLKLPTIQKTDTMESFPNPDVLLPEVKKEIENLTKDLYRSHSTGIINISE
jgi:hypothetical protein